MSTPNEETWKQVTKLKDFKPTFPRWKESHFESLCTRLPPDGIDLLSRLLVYDPVSRITVEEALDHPYFSSLDKSRYAPREYY